MMMMMIRMMMMQIMIMEKKWAREERKRERGHAGGGKGRLVNIYQLLSAYCLDFYFSGDASRVIFFPFPFCDLLFTSILFVHPDRMCQQYKMAHFSVFHHIA